MSASKTNNQGKALADKKDGEGTGAKIETMTIAVSAKTLFIMNDQQASQTTGETKLGVAFPFVKALVKANYYFQKLYPDNEMPFKIFLMNNTATQGQYLRDSLNEFELSEICIHEDDISKLAGNILYLTEDHVKAENAIKKGHAAGIMFQKSQINALEDSANSLKNKMVHRQSGSSSGMAMHLPMSSMSIMTDDTSEDPKPKDEPSIPKLCMQQAVEAGPGDFRPQCDEQGNFMPMQCEQNPKICWCVNPLGQRIPGTARPGKVICGGMSRAMARMAAMPSMMEMKDE